jgi:DNA-binding MarR family transcriptional regulator
MAARIPKPLNLAEFLPYRLSVLTNKVSRAFARLYATRFNLSVPEWRVMAVLGQDPGLSADGVCARTEMDKVTVSRAVARLREKGYLTRRVSSIDRRRSELQLSKAGYGIYAQIIPLGRKYEAQLLELLSDADRRLLDQILTRLDAHAQTLQ